MVSGSHKNIWRDESGAALIEFTAAVLTFFLLLFGVVEFANVFFQWNSATKAVQLGARLAAVSDPVYVTNPQDFTATVSGYNAGDTLAANAYDLTCNGSLGTCVCTGSICPNNVTYDATKMRQIIYGRGNTTSTCINTGANIGMCNIFTRVTPQNVIVRYQYTGLGYAGRPGGPVPTITVSITGLTYDFILIGGLAGLSSMQLPGFATTVTGEDLNVSGS